VRGGEGSRRRLTSEAGCCVSAASVCGEWVVCGGVGAYAEPCPDTLTQAHTCCSSPAPPPPPAQLGGGAAADPTPSPCCGGGNARSGALEVGRSLLVWKLLLLPASRADEGVVAAAALGLHWQSRSVVVVVVARQDMARIDPRHSLVGAGRRSQAGPGFECGGWGSAAAAPLGGGGRWLLLGPQLFK